VSRMATAPHDECSDDTPENYIFIDHASFDPYETEGGIGCTSFSSIPDPNICTTQSSDKDKPYYLIEIATMCECGLPVGRGFEADAFISAGAKMWRTDIQYRYIPWDPGNKITGGYFRSYSSFTPNAICAPASSCSLDSSLGTQANYVYNIYAIDITLTLLGLFVS
jgi:hypothetical protein